MSFVPKIGIQDNISKIPTTILKVLIDFDNPWLDKISEWNDWRLWSAYAVLNLVDWDWRETWDISCNDMIKCSPAPGDGDLAAPTTTKFLSSTQNSSDTSVEVIYLIEVYLVKIN